MKQVKDTNGAVLRGVFKTPAGGIVINDVAALKIYETKRNAATKTVDDITALRQQVKELSDYIKLLKKDNNG